MLVFGLRVYRFWDLGDVRHGLNLGVSDGFESRLRGLWLYMGFSWGGGWVWGLVELWDGFM